MTRKLLKTAAIVVIALAPVVAAGSAEAHGGRFWWRLSRRGFSRGGFGRGGFRDRGFRGDRFRFGGIFGGWFLPRLLWRLLPRLLRIRLLLSDRIRDHALLMITAGCPGSIAVPHRPRSPGLLPGLMGARAPDPPMISVSSLRLFLRGRL
jgi:hypothetical protein